jgi:hypothetical protein
VKGSISGCPSTIPIFSDKIPVSFCPTDSDNDGTNNNIDIDYDNDGILNCTESLGDLAINLSNTTSGSITLGSYDNPFSGTISTSGSSPAVTNPFIGTANGSFSSETPAGKDNTVSYVMSFTNPISVSLEYIQSANPSDLINSDAEFIISSPTNKTVTVLNPTNQLLIDTNYDGVFESGITEYSSFEIRFRLNSVIPLAAGTGTFSFKSYLTESLTFVQKNLSDTSSNKASFLIKATCVPKDSDNDGTTDDLDTDSDNDGILDIIEAQPNNSVVISNADTNKNGLDNAFEPGFIPFDKDSDGVPDYLDLDSDNDGILDSIETGNDLDRDGIRNYRDALNKGTVSFGKGLKIGVLITLLSSITFGLINVVYTEIINPEFTAEYYEYSIEKYKESLPAEAFKTKLIELESQKDLFENPLVNFVIMALTVFIIGFIISLISGLILQRKN